MDYPVRYRDPLGNIGSEIARPYLWVHVVGPNGRQGPIYGLIDTGADNTVLPLDYAELMGYQPAELTIEDANQVTGSTQVFKAGRECVAWVSGLEPYHFPLRPWFVDGASPLWGRMDFMLAFQIEFDEAARTFVLRAPDEHFGRT